MGRLIGKLVFVSSCIILVLYAFLPKMGQFFIEQTWKDALATYQIQFDMEALGLSRCLVRNIRIGDNIRMQSLELCYGLSRKKDSSVRPIISSLIVSGLDIHAVQDNQGNFSIRGLDLSSRETTSPGPPALDIKTIQTLLSWMPQTLKIENGVLHLATENQSLYVPMNLAIHTNPGTRQIATEAKMQILGNALEISSDLEWAKDSVSGNLCLSLTRKDSRIPPLCLSGNLDISPGSTQNAFPCIVFQAQTLPAETWEFARGQDKILLSSPACTIDFSQRDQKRFADIVFTASQGDLFFQGHRGKFQEMKCTARFQNKPQGKPQGKPQAKSLTGFIDLALGKSDLSLDSTRLSIGRVAARLPFTFPFFQETTGTKQSKDFPPKGRLTAEAITSSLVPEMPLNLRAELAQTSKAMKITGNIACPGLEKSKLQFAGAVRYLPELQGFLNISCPQFLLDSHEILPLLPLKEMGVNFDLDVSGSGRVFWNQEQGLISSGFLEIHQGSVQNTDHTFEAKGIKTHIQFDDLVSPTSLPGQQVFVETIKAGNLLFNNANLRFTLEKGHVIIMENARVQWCKGLVSTEAVRFPPDKEALILTMYCDRLQLPMLLDQLGGFHSQGTGSVSGRIPVSYHNGFFSFENGFLFSSPGTGGRILLKNTDKLLAGIPVGSPQFAQLDLAREALKEFDYEWVTLGLNSQKQTLMMKMELNGKPAKALPFVYNRDIGSFVRVEASNPGSRFQGIKLDVNLQLPFHQFIKFGNSLLHNPL